MCGYTDPNLREKFKSYDDYKIWSYNQQDEDFKKEISLRVFLNKYTQCDRCGTWDTDFCICYAR